MAKPLNDKLAIVTGASSGIGEACARQLAEAGARVMLGARRVARLAQVESAIRDNGGRVAAFELDVSNAESCQAFMSRIRREHGTSDILINNAGLARGFSSVVDNDE